MTIRTNTKKKKKTKDKTDWVISNKKLGKTQSIQINRDNQDREKIPDDLPDNQEKKKSEIVYRLVGGINSVREKEVARKDSDHYGQVFYELDVKERIENDKENIKTIYVFEDVIVTEKVWKAIKNNEWIDKRYVFFCYLKNKNKQRLYRLFNWEEIPRKE